jgi:hypothetical protein
VLTLVRGMNFISWNIWTDVGSADSYYSFNLTAILIIVQGACKLSEDFVMP